MRNVMTSQFVKVWMVCLTLFLISTLGYLYSGLGQSQQTQQTQQTQQISVHELAYRVSRLLRAKHPGAAPYVPWRDVTRSIAREFAKAPDMTCKNMQMAGNYKICQDERYRIKRPCLVYSFGIFNDWAFDEHMSSLGCEVHAFDPSIGKEDHTHNPGNISFHNLGIGPIDTDTFEPEFDVFVKTKTIWKVRTVKSIMKMLGHEGRKLDVFKIDVETDEWETLINMVDTGLLPFIKQFLIEWHIFSKYPSKDRYSEYLYAYMTLKDLGFKAFSQSFHKREYNSDDSVKFQCDAYYVNSYFR